MSHLVMTWVPGHQNGAGGMFNLNLHVGIEPTTQAHRTHTAEGHYLFIFIHVCVDFTQVLKRRGVRGLFL